MKKLSILFAFAAPLLASCANKPLCIAFPPTSTPSIKLCVNSELKEIPSGYVSKSFVRRDSPNTQYGAAGALAVGIIAAATYNDDLLLPGDVEKNLAAAGLNLQEETLKFIEPELKKSGYALSPNASWSLQPASLVIQIIQSSRQNEEKRYSIFVMSAIELKNERNKQIWIQSAAAASQSYTRLELSNSKIFVKALQGTFTKVASTFVNGKTLN